MRNEPAIDREALCAGLRDAHGLEPVSLTFVPVGYATACYIVDCGEAGRRFLKLWPDTVAGREAGARQVWVLPLLDAIARRDLLPVPCPLPTRTGALSVSVLGGSLALFRLIDGTTPAGWPRWGQDRWEALGRAMAAIHGATPHLLDVLPPSDLSQPNFVSDLHELLEVVDGSRAAARPRLDALRAALDCRVTEVRRQIERLDRVARRAAERRGAPLLCHTDLGGDNVLFDRQNRLWLLDWDDATLASPELDLRVGVEWRHLSSFLRAYREAGGVAALSLDRFEMYLLRRSLGDAHARLARLLRDDVPPEDVPDLIDGIRRWGFTEWRALDRRLARLEAVLR